MNVNEIRVGTRLFCNGYPGTVTKICDGQLTGMAEVQLASGPVCVDINELARFHDYDASAGASHPSDPTLPREPPPGITTRIAAQWVCDTCLSFGSSVATAHKVAGFFAEALENDKRSP